MNFICSLSQRQPILTSQMPGPLLIAGKVRRRTEATLHCALNVWGLTRLLFPSRDGEAGGDEDSQTVARVEETRGAVEHFAFHLGKFMVSGRVFESI